MKIKKLIYLSLTAILALSLVACSGNNSEKKESESNKKEVKTVKVGTSDPIIKEMLDAVQKDYLDDGYKMEVTLFDGDIISPNSGVAEGSLDANFYQHNAFLEQFNKDKGTDLSAVGEPIYYSKMGVYSDKLKSLNDIKDNMKVAIPSDATNKSRALVLLADENLIKLKDGVKTYSPLDVVENKHKLEFVEMDTVKIPSTLPDVDFGVVRAIQIMKSDKDPESALAFDKHGPEYGIVLATKSENKEQEWAKVLAKELKGQKVKDVIEKNYGTTSVLIEDK